MACILELKTGGNKMTDVTIQNDITYLFLQWIGWDYNFWTVIFADIVLVAMFFGGIFLMGLIFTLLGWLK